MALTKLNNQSLSAVTSAGIPTLASANLPSGSLINTAQHYHQMTATQTQTSDAYADVTGSSFTYTPVSSSSTIILDFTGNMRGFAPSSQDVLGYIKSYYNGASGNAYVLAGDNLGKLGDSIWFPFFFAFKQKIAPADHTTSAIAIKLQFRAGSTGQTGQFQSGSSHVACNVYEIAG